MLSGNPEEAEYEQLYFLQFKFLSTLADSYANDKLNNLGKFDETKLTNKELMSNQPLFSAIDWSKIKIEKKELPNNVVEYIYDFGEPKDEPLCRFAIFYVDPNNELYEYYTLEKSKEFKTYPYYVCRQEKGKHYDFCECQPDLTVFEKIVQDLVEKKIKAIENFIKAYAGNNDPLLHQELYQLEFRFLPKLCEIFEREKTNNPDKELNEDELLIDLEKMKNNIPSQRIDWSQFKFWKKILPNNAKEFIYDFGEPKEFPLCRFAIFYVDQLNKIFEYITLEKTVNFKKFPFIVCGQKGPQHKNYGIECPGDLDTFEKIAQEIVGKQINPKTGFNSETFTMGINK